MMGKVGVGSLKQQTLHSMFVSSLGGRTRYAPGNRSSDGGAGKRRHRSTRIGGKGK